MSFYNIFSVTNFYFSILLIKIIYLHNKIIYLKTQIKTKTQITTCYHHHHEQPSTHQPITDPKPINPSTTTTPIKPINPTNPSASIKKTQIATQTSSFSHRSQQGGKKRKKKHTHTQPRLQPRRIGSQPTSAALFNTRFSTSVPINSRSSSRYPTASSWKDRPMPRTDRNRQQR